MSKKSSSRGISPKAPVVLGALALSALALTSACDSIRSSAIPEAPLWLHHPGTALSVVYRRTITAEARVEDIPYERGRPEIDAAHRRVFVGSSDHGLYALRAEDGATLWRFETLGAVQGEPLYDLAEDVVFFGSNDGALYKVRARDGSLMWRFESNSEVARRPVLKDGVLYVTNANDTLMAIESASGKLRWSQHRAPAGVMEIAAYAGPAIGAGKVYTGFSDGVVSAYSMIDGAEQWLPVDLAAEAEQAAGGEPPRFLDVDTTPIFTHISSGDVVLVGSYAAGVFALDASDGTRAWATEEATGATDLLLWEQPAHPARGREGLTVPAKRVLIVSSGPTGLWGLDPEDGRVLWRRPVPDGGISAPVAYEGTVLVTTSHYGLFLFSPLDGAVIDGIETGGDFAMTPAAMGTRAFVMSNGGTFLGLHITTPKPPKG